MENKRWRPISVEQQQNKSVDQNQRPLRIIRVLPVKTIIFLSPFRPLLTMVLYRIGIFMYRLVAFVFNTLLAGLDIIWVCIGGAI